MMIRTLCVTVIATSIAGSAAASFTGWTADVFQLASGHTAMNVYATFSQSGDKLLNIYSSHITTTVAGGFHQSTDNPFWAPGAQDVNTADDSFVCFGTSAGGLAVPGAVLPDPSFVNFDDSNGATQFNVIQGTFGGAGWYNPNPTTMYGSPVNGRVLVAHFVVAGDAPVEGVLNWQASISYNDPFGQTLTGIGSAAQVFDWGSGAVPAPGTIIVVAAAGLRCRRRRW
jgi:hypothetical protein